MIIFKYCPHCCSENIELVNNRRFECFDCGMVYFHNVAAAVAVIIENDNEILFTIRNRDPKLGSLDLPGGFTDPDETAEQTCQRELKEELDLNFELSDFTYYKSFPNDYTYRGIPYKTEDLIFRTQLLLNQSIRIEKDEINAIKWIKKSDIVLEEIGFDSLRNALKEYLKEN